MSKNTNSTGERVGDVLAGIVLGMMIASWLTKEAQRTDLQSEEAYVRAEEDAIADLYENR